MLKTAQVSHRKATLTGLVAILLWSGIVGLIRKVSDYFGALNGALLIYSLAAIFLLFIFGKPKLKSFPKIYLIVGSILFVAYEICLSFSLGYAQNASQAIEIGMVNYLWPSLTIILSLISERKRMRWLIIPGILLSVLGLCLVLGGSNGFSLDQIAYNLANNPLSYGLAFMGAIIWSIYCVFTRKYANGSNGITLFFCLTALTLWIKYFTSPQTPFYFSWPAVIVLFFASAAMALGYAAWNIGILRGNVTILATASYFIPVLSAALASFILASTLPLSFWQGSSMVCIGSLICWLSTNEINQRTVFKNIKVKYYQRMRRHKNSSRRD